MRGKQGTRITVRGKAGDRDNGEGKNRRVMITMRGKTRTRIMMRGKKGKGVLERRIGMDGGGIEG